MADTARTRLLGGTRPLSRHIHLDEPVTVIANLPPPAGRHGPPGVPRTQGSRFRHAATRRAPRGVRDRRTPKPSGASPHQSAAGTSPHNSPNCQSQGTGHSDNEKPEVANPFEFVTSGPCGS